MIEIISSKIVLNNLQQDGRRNIIEDHYDNVGNVYTYSYMADVGEDVTAKMLSRVPDVLAEAEQFYSENN